MCEITASGPDEQLLVIEYFLHVYTDIEVEFSAPIYSTNESTGVLQATLVSTLALSTNYIIRVRFRPGTASSKQNNCYTFIDADVQEIRTLILVHRESVFLLGKLE